MPDDLKLPPGAKLIDDGIKLPPGAKLLQGPHDPTAKEKAPYKGGPADLPFPSNQDLARLGKYLPGALATGAALFQPELLPVAGGFFPTAAAASGLAAAGGMIGSGVQQGLETAAGLEERPRSLREAGTRLGKEAAEQAGYELGGRMIAKPFEFVISKLKPQRLYQSALKPSTTLGVKERDKLIQTGLREKIPTSGAGYEKLISSITDLTKEIDAKIAAKSPDLGAVISPDVVARRLDALEHFYETQAAPAEDLSAIRNVREQFLKRHSFEAPFSEVRAGTQEAEGEIVPTGRLGSTTMRRDMTLAEAQAEKRGTQRFNANKYGERGTARDESEKALASGLREQISALFPEVKALNARDSEMLALEEQLRKFVGREGNKNVIGLTGAIIGSAAGLFGAATGSPTEEIGGGGALLAGAAIALGDPEVKSRLAIALAKASKSRISSAAGRLGRELPSIAARGIGAQF